MPQVLKLEYVCTEAEREQADELNVRHQIAGGSKWRTNAVFLAIIVIVLLGFYLRTMREVSPEYRPYVFGAVFLLIVILFILRRWWARRKPSAVTKLEISEKEVSIQASDANVTMPWSAFSKCLESPTLFVLVDRPKVLLFILPKRAFPDESWQSWFRHQAANRIGTNDALLNEAPSVTRAVSADTLVLKFQLGFRDYLDRTMASWRTWAMVLFILMLMDGMFLYSIIDPPPHALDAPAQAFLKFMLPFHFVIVAIGVLIPTLHAWYAHKKGLVPLEVALSNAGIAFASRDEQSHMKWNAYACFKETAWSFILWSSPASAWLMLPKRAFASRHDIRRCAELLSSNLRRSRWFFG